LATWNASEISGILSGGDSRLARHTLLIAAHNDATHEFLWVPLNLQAFWQHAPANSMPPPL
jgi:hypothetical protein